MSATVTIADLHAVLRAAFGWSGQNLHRLVIHGREYGISYVGGPGFRDDAHRVALTDLGLRTTERFAYHYDFTDDWRLDLRVANSMAAEADRSYPRCTGGRRAGLSSRVRPDLGDRPRCPRSWVVRMRADASP